MAARPASGRGFRLPLGAWTLALGSLVGPQSGPAWSQDAAIAGRLGLSPPEVPAMAPATCSDLGTTLAGLEEPGTRIDLTVKGRLTLVQTDGALWYLAVCSAPGIRVLCVTYEGNGMGLGDPVVLRGGYNRQDEHHVVLDPCLASRS